MHKNFFFLLFFRLVKVDVNAVCSRFTLPLMFPFSPFTILGSKFSYCSSYGMSMMGMSTLMMMAMVVDMMIAIMMTWLSFYVQSHCIVHGRQSNVKIEKGSVTLFETYLVYDEKYEYFGFCSLLQK